MIYFSPERRARRLQLSERPPRPHMDDTTRGETRPARHAGLEDRDRSRWFDAPWQAAKRAAPAHWSETRTADPSFLAHRCLLAPRTGGIIPESTPSVSRDPFRFLSASPCAVSPHGQVAPPAHHTAIGIGLVAASRRCTLHGGPLSPARRPLSIVASTYTAGPRVSFRRRRAVRIGTWPVFTSMYRTYTQLYLPGLLTVTK